jgi:hypothetical protein
LEIQVFFRIFLNILKNVIMKNREIIMRRLERIESNMSKLDLILKRQGSREEFEEIIADTKEHINDAKSFVQQEPLSPGEIN